MTDNEDAHLAEQLRSDADGIQIHNVTCDYVRDRLREAAARLTALTADVEKAEASEARMRAQWDEQFNRAEAAERERDEALARWHDNCLIADAAHDRAEAAEREIALLRAALEQLAAGWSSPPTTVADGAAHLGEEFQRRMQIAADALGDR